MIQEHAHTQTIIVNTTTLIITILVQPDGLYKKVTLLMLWAENVAQFPPKLSIFTYTLLYFIIYGSPLALALKHGYSSWGPTYTHTLHT